MFTPQPPATLLTLARAPPAFGYLPTNLTLAPERLSKDCSHHHSAAPMGFSPRAALSLDSEQQGETPAHTPPSVRLQSTATLRGTSYHVTMDTPSFPRPPQTSVNQKFGFAISVSSHRWSGSSCDDHNIGRRQEFSWVSGGQCHAQAQHLPHPSLYPTMDSQVEGWPKGQPEPAPHLKSRSTWHVGSPKQVWCGPKPADATTEPSVPGMYKQKGR